MSNFEHKISEQPSQTTKKKQARWLILVTGLMLILCLCTAATAALIYFDPFDWGVFGRLFGGYDAIARTVPEEVEMYVTIDMLKFLSADSQEIISAFVGSRHDQNVDTREELLQELDAALMDEYGVTFSSDILPWIGQYAGLSFYELNLGEEIDMDKMVFAVEARSRRAADIFITSLTDELAENSSEELQTIDHLGSTIYVLDDPASPIAISRYRSILLLSHNPVYVQRSIDAANGASLADSSGYQEILSNLPKSRLATVYTSSVLFSQIKALPGTLVLGASGTADSSQKGGLGISLMDTGIKVDVITSYALENLSQSQIDRLTQQGAEGRLAEEMPQDSLLFLSGHDLGLAWEGLFDNLQQSSGMSPIETGELMELFGGQIDVDLQEDLFPYLDEEWAVSLVHERGSLWTEQLEMPLGLLCIAEASDAALMGQRVRTIAESLDGNMLINIDENNRGGMTTYDASLFLMGNPLFSFGISEEFFLFSTSTERLETLTETGRLAETAVWQRTWASMPAGMSPVLFADLEQLRGVLPESPLFSFEILKPVHSLALANSPLEGNIRHSVLLLTVAED